MREHGMLDEHTGLGFVSDLLRDKARAQVITARADARVRDVIGLLKDNGISQIPVVKAGALIGVVTEVALLRYLASGEYSLSSEVEPLAETDYATVTPNTGVENLQSLLGQARMAIVLDRDEIIGVITKIDLIEYLARRRNRSGSGSIAPPRA
jgi:cystathionine beta-synthase